MDKLNQELSLVTPIKNLAMKSQVQPAYLLAGLYLFCTIWVISGLPGHVSIVSLITIPYPVLKTSLAIELPRGDTSARERA